MEKNEFFKSENEQQEQMPNEGKIKLNKRTIAKFVPNQLDLINGGQINPTNGGDGPQTNSCVACISARVYDDPCN